MDTVRLSLEGAWSLLWVGLMLGAGLPIVFGTGVRFLAGPEESVTEGGLVVNHSPSVAARAFAWLCFAVVLFGVVVGIMVIVGAGMGKVVSFEHIFPTLVPKP